MEGQFIEYYDDADEWDGVEAIFTQQLENARSQNDCKGGDSEEEDDDNNDNDDESEYMDAKPSSFAKELFKAEVGGDTYAQTKTSANCASYDAQRTYKQSTINRVSTVNADVADEFDDGIDDNELMNIDLNTVTTSNSSGGNYNVKPEVSEPNQEEKPSSTKPPKKKQPSLFDSINMTKAYKKRQSNGAAHNQMANTQHFAVGAQKEKKLSASNKRRKSRNSTSSAQSNTLTQHYGCQADDTPPSTKKHTRGSIERNDTGLVTIKVGIREKSFKPGDYWVPRDKTLKDFVFKLGGISLASMVNEAVIDAAWMKLEHTIIGKTEADSVKQNIGVEWVLVKQHELLPTSGRIQLQKLDKRIIEGMPNEATALCYKMEGKITHTFEYQCGKSLPQHMRPTECPTAIDYFAGGGGMSRGLHDAGFDVRWKNELNKTACDTLQMNFPHSLVFCEDIATFTQECQNQTVNIYPSPNNPPTLSHMSPPCQAFSGVNTSGGANDDQNAQCTNKAGEAIHILSSTYVTMENVPGMTQQKHIKYLLRFMGCLLSFGYQVKVCEVNASHFGDPQNRRRVIVLAAKKGYILPVLTPTHGEGRLNVATAGDTLRTLEDVAPSTKMGGLAGLADGGHIFDHYKKATELSDKCDNDYQLNCNLPANTIRKANRLRHYKMDRYCTVRERARLQSFPDNHHFAGTLTDAFNQIGNAVPVKLATAIGKAVIESYRLGKHEMPKV